MRDLLAVVLIALPLLTACQPANDKAATGEAIAEGAGLGDGPTGRTGDSVARGAEKGPIPADIDEGVESDRSTAATATNNTVGATGERTPATLPTQIPDQFHGRWGINAADCLGGAAAKGLLLIDDSRLTFYESRGTLDRIDGNSPANVFTANYGFTGEGMAWERVITLTRTGPRLRRVEQGGPEGPVDLTYTACPR